MATVSDYNGLKDNINGLLANSLSSGVNEMIKTKVNARISSDVYGAYKPQIYKRKYVLYEDKNHNKEVSVDNNGVSLRYYHRAYMSGKDLTKLILLGQDGARAYGSGVALYNDNYIMAYKASGANDRIPFFKPRNFITGAKSDIKKSDIVKILKSGIR